MMAGIYGNSTEYFQKNPLDQNEQDNTIIDVRYK